MSGSSVAGHYEKTVDRESAYEKLQARAAEKTAIAPPGAAPRGSDPKSSLFGKIGSVFEPSIGPRGAIHDSMATSMAKSAMRAASSQMGRQLIRGVLGGLFGRGGRR